MQNNIVSITSSTTWIVPKDWSNQNKIQLTGGGGGGGDYAYYITDSGGGYLWYYTLGGAGGGYAEATNLNNLKPGDAISITIGSGGGAGNRYGGPGGTTSFGGLIFANGGTVGTGNIPPHYGGSGSISLSPGTYDTSRINSGQSKSWFGINFSPDPSLYVGGTSGGSSISGGISGGNGGLGGRSYTILPTGGQSGLVVITYQPAGTHQACVWIS